jgi:hypothetical protein
VRAAYNEQYSSEKLSKSTFLNLKPWFVKPGILNTCVCKYCQQKALCSKAVLNIAQHLVKLTRKTLACEVLMCFCHALKKYEDAKRLMKTRALAGAQGEGVLPKLVPRGEGVLP